MDKNAPAAALCPFLQPPAVDVDQGVDGSIIALWRQNNARKSHSKLEFMRKMNARSGTSGWKPPPTWAGVARAMFLERHSEGQAVAWTGMTTNETGRWLASAL